MSMPPWWRGVRWADEHGVIHQTFTFDRRFHHQFRALLWCGIETTAPWSPTEREVTCLACVREK